MCLMRTTGILRVRRNVNEKLRTTERLLQSHGGVGWAGGHDLRCVSQQPWGQKLASISPFQDNPVIPSTLFKLVFFLLISNIFFKVENLPNLLGETKKFIKGSKVTTSNTKVKPNVRPCYK